MTHPLLENPFVKMALDRFLAIEPAEKLKLLESVATLLDVRPGFWDTSEKPPMQCLCVVECGSEGGASDWQIATFDGAVWKHAATGVDPKPIAQPVKRWAVIPAR